VINRHVHRAMPAKLLKADYWRLSEFGIVEPQEERQMSGPEVMYVRVSRLLVIGLLIVISSAECLAQQTAVPTTTLPESLSEEVNDPTATLTQAQIKEDFTPSEFGTNAQPNTLQGRFILAILPHGPLDLAQIVRPTFSLVTIPQNKSASTRTEFGDSQLLDLFVMPKSMTEGIDFRWAIDRISFFPPRVRGRLDAAHGKLVLQQHSGIVRFLDC
jgi:hypothetical protein